VLGSFTARRFVLVGDTGERDPEIYADVAREHPAKVAAIYLRDPTPGGTPGLAERLDAVFEGVSRESWHVVADGTGLPASL
jgi:phosphatidate phosphatase APP1